MGKTIILALIAAAMGAVLYGCSNPDEPDIDVPVSKPGEDPFSPAGVSAAGGGGGGGGETKAPETKAPETKAPEKK